MGIRTNSAQFGIFKSTCGFFHKYLRGFSTSTWGVFPQVLFEIRKSTCGKTPQVLAGKTWKYLSFNARNETNTIPEQILYVNLNVGSSTW